MCKRCIPAASYQYGLFKLMLMGPQGFGDLGRRAIYYQGAGEHL